MRDIYFLTNQTSRFLFLVIAACCMMASTNALQAQMFNFEASNAQFFDENNVELTDSFDYRLVFVTFPAVSQNGLGTNTGTILGDLDQRVDIAAYKVDDVDRAWQAIASADDGGIVTNAKTHTNTDPTSSNQPKIFMATSATTAVKIADSYSDLWDGDIDHEINYNQFLAPLNLFIPDVATGTDEFGNALNPMLNVPTTNVDDVFQYGDPLATSSGWISSGQKTYNIEDPFLGVFSPLPASTYGISQGTFSRGGNVPIPEPSTYLMLGSMLCLAMLVKRKKKRPEAA